MRDFTPKRFVQIAAIQKAIDPEFISINTAKSARKIVTKPVAQGHGSINIKSRDQLNHTQVRMMK